MWDASVIDTRSTTSACRSSAFRLTLSSTCVTELFWFERHHLGEVAIRGAESLGRRNWAAHSLAEIFRRHVFVIHRLSLCSLHPSRLPRNKSPATDYLLRHNQWLRPSRYCPVSPNRSPGSYLPTRSPQR